MDPHTSKALLGKRGDMVCSHRTGGVPSPVQLLLNSWLLTLMQLAADIIWEQSLKDKFKLFFYIQIRKRKKEKRIKCRLPNEGNGMNSDLINPTEGTHLSKPFYHKLLRKIAMVIKIFKFFLKKKNMTKC